MPLMEEKVSNRQHLLGCRLAPSFSCTTVYTHSTLRLLSILLAQAALFSGGGALSMRLWRWNLGRFWSACELVALGPALAAMTAVTGTACVAGGAALIAGATWHDWWRWWGRGPPGDGPPGSQRQTPPDAQQQQQEQEQQPRLRRWQRWWQQVWQWPPHRATYAAGAAVAGAVMPLISWLDEHGDELEAQLQQAVVAA